MSLFFKLVFREMQIFSWTSFRYVLAVTIGVGSVAGINSYKNNLKSSIALESKNLLGGDLQIERGYKIEEDDLGYIKNLFPKDTELKQIVTFPSMLSNPQANEIALSTVKAMEKDYPFYGNVVTIPELAYEQLKKNEILLEENLAKNLKLQIGDKVKLGKKKFTLAGYIQREPGNVGSFLSMAPSSIILLDALTSTGLEQRGSRIRYAVLLKVPSEFDPKELKEKLFPKLTKRDLILYHHNEIGSGSQKFINTTYDYISLIGFSAFFLGAISILISTRARIQSRTNEIAIYKCLGARTDFYAQIFLLEMLLLSMIGSILGLILGYLIQFQIPNITGSDFLSNIQPKLDRDSLIWGFAVGLVLPLVLGVESIYKISKLSPILAFKGSSSFQSEKGNKTIEIVQVLLIYLFFTVLSFLETKQFTKSLSMVGVLVLLPILTYVLFTGIRKLYSFVKDKYVFYGIFKIVLSKFSRGENFTLVIIGISSSISIFLLTLVLEQSIISLSGWNLQDERANVFVLDLQKDQLEYFRELQSKYKVQSNFIAPVIGARLLKINGKEVDKSQTEMDALQRDWRSTARTREYFLSYRDKLYETEKLIQGKYWEEGDFSQISIEHEFAKALGVKVGDTLTFNVQGVEIEGKITNTRYVNWAAMKPNFVVLFNSYALSNAPGYFLSSFYLKDSETRYSFQKELVSRYPNVVFIDIAKTLQGIEKVIEKVTSIVQLLSSFLFMSSLLLLFSAHALKHKERVSEISFYKVVGANSWFLRKNYFYEGLLLTETSFIIGLSLAIFSNYVFSEWILKIQYELPFLKIGFIFISVNFIILFLYMASIQKSILSRPKDFLRNLS